MPDTTYWMKEVRACIRSSFPELVGGYDLDAPTDDHPSAARVVLTGGDTPSLLHRPLEQHSFVVRPAPGALVILDRDPFPWPYHPDHDGLVDDAEPHRRHNAVTHVPHREDR